MRPVRFTWGGCRCSEGGGGSNNGADSDSCGRQIRVMERSVVTFKADLSTAEVHDDSIKGPLKVGVVVEVKNQDGVYQEATINKLTDASIYTVVFDDGDEKTLRAPLFV
ncbi:hypothetical protein WMY93_018726 [Mugilogobius chulae]|uniref:DUF4926 domain-containing protein n=1 Tax=Mugilogobius chulae TaxID=88201 RepID=A0AAW0NVQ6_9GOBI